jgi:DNA-binding response OmpR family regulator
MMGNSTKILIVDDDTLLSKMYQKKLSIEGFDVSSAGNGEEGLGKAKTEKPNLIMLDIMMPKMDGFETLKQLKANDDTKDIPVIFLTNLASDEEDAKKGLELGAVTYLIKSKLGPAGVVEKVKEVLTK